jgi:4-amino-4-deoxy-L-arabinose transferase-like glycosyltransferase
MRTTTQNLLNRFQPPLAVSVMLCLCLSILFSLFIYPIIEQPYHAQQDVDRYAEIGQSLYRGNGFRFEGVDLPTVSRGPIYPLVIAALSWVTGGFAVWHIQLLQAIFLAGACIVIFFTARQVFSPVVAHWSALALALYPLCIWYAARIWTESLLVLGVSFLVYRLIRYHRAPTFGRGMMVGIVAGFLTLVKAIILLLIQIPVLFFAFRKIRKAVRENALVVPLILTIVYWWGISALFVAHARIAVPVMPLVLVLAVYGMVRRA